MMFIANLLGGYCAHVSNHVADGMAAGRMGPQREIDARARFSKLMASRFEARFIFYRDITQVTYRAPE